MSPPRPSLAEFAERVAGVQLQPWQRALVRAIEAGNVPADRLRVQLLIRPPGKLLAFFVSQATPDEIAAYIAARSVASRNAVVMRQRARIAREGRSAGRGAWPRPNPKRQRRPG